jgi:hypothetical protein|tara:strand:- start:86 stop:316 length:231 start_codon:yes stop_codon:yes gene_type:complete
MKNHKNHKKISITTLICDLDVLNIPDFYRRCSVFILTIFCGFVADSTKNQYLTTITAATNSHKPTTNYVILGEVCG